MANSCIVSTFHFFQTLALANSCTVSTFHFFQSFIFPGFCFQRLFIMRPAFLLFASLTHIVRASSRVEEDPCTKLCKFDGPSICTGGSWTKNGGICHGYMYREYPRHHCYHSRENVAYCPSGHPVAARDVDSIISTFQAAIPANFGHGICVEAVQDSVLICFDPLPRDNCRRSFYFSYPRDEMVIGKHKRAAELALAFGAQTSSLFSLINMQNLISFTMSENSIPRGSSLSHLSCVDRNGSSVGTLYVLGERIDESVETQRRICAAMLQAKAEINSRAVGL